MNDAVEEAKRVAKKDGSLDKAEGHSKEIVGKIKAKVGQVIGNENLEAEGIAQAAEGMAQRVKGEIEEGVNHAVQTAKASAEIIGEKLKEVLHK